MGGRRPHETSNAMISALDFKKSTTGTSLSMSRVKIAGKDRKILRASRDPFPGSIEKLRLAHLVRFHS
jgi:hypothetical protein